MKASLSRGIVLASLAVGIGMVAFAGISLAVSDDGGTTGTSAQTPLGERSAPRALAEEGGGGNLDEQVESLGQGAAPDSAASPGTGAGSTGTADSSSLPFTGLLAIPLLVAGAALLGGGLLLRRRETAPTRP